MKQIFLFAAALMALSSCQKEMKNDNKSRFFKGETKTFQHGSAWTWFEVDKTNKPLRIAIAINEAAMESLDRGHAGDEGGHSHANSISLKLPAQASFTPFKHVLLEWNSHGHPPQNVYTKAHFDFHFYTSSEAERLLIPAYEQAQEKFDNFPFAYMPQDYVPIPGGVPQMGTHWVYKFAPELAGNNSFTETFLYGSYDGEVTFYEPMITEAFLKANPTFQRAIPVPAKFKKTGWYPTRLRISKENGVTNIMIEDFVKRTAS